MRIKFIRDEDVVNYKETSMFIGTCFCTFKCCHEAGLPESVCQNEPWSKEPIIDYNNNKIIDRYINNPITNAVVIGGMEPFCQAEELIEFTKCFREVTNDTIVIYTGYKETEIIEHIKVLSQYKNIIIKFGRYIPGQKPHYDEVLGVDLVSDNQYARRIS